MITMAIVTPSYRPDLERFRRLHGSFLRNSDDDVLHHVIVPGIDADAFRSIASDRLRVWPYQEIMPPGIIATDRLAAAARRVPGLPRSFNCAAINWRRPWKPVRGWVLQQLVKLEMGHRLDEDVLVYVDSDVVIARHLRLEDFCRDGITRFFTVEGAIDRSMRRHFLWCEASHELLGLAWEDLDTYPDHVAGVIPWDRRLLVACLARVESVTGLPWSVAVTRYLHFSEYILYGTYVRNLGTPRDLEFLSDANQCHSYWLPEPLREADVGEFVAGFMKDHVAVNFQSYSDTDASVVRAVMEQVSDPTRR